mgnify:CR=1 FL=1
MDDAAPTLVTPAPMAGPDAGASGLRRGRRRADRLLTLAAEQGLRLLGEGDLTELMQQSLAALGETTGADRVYLFEGHALAGHPRRVYSQRYEWVREGIVAMADEPLVQNLDAEVHAPYLAGILTSGRTVNAHVHTVPEPDRSLLAMQGIRTILMVPVLLGGDFWGFLGLDAVRRARRWLPVEERLLETVAASLGAGVMRHRSEAALRLGAQVFDSSRESIVVTDMEGRIVAVNAALERMSGHRREALIGASARKLDTAREDEGFYARVQEALQTQGHWQGEHWLRRLDGAELPQWLSLSVVSDAQGRPTHRVAMGTDITELKRTEAQLSFLADHDVLTRLPNRRLAQRSLQASLAQASGSGGQLAVLFVDLDRFKGVNDSLGHAAGDAALREAATRMRARLRQGDLLARLGGDEFLIVLHDAGDAAQAQAVARGLQERLREPMRVDGRDIYLGASIGIALSPQHAQDADTLVRYADMAMYAAKLAGRDSVGVFQPAMADLSLRMLELEARARRAVEQQALGLHYQSVHDLRDGRELGVEALLRIPAAAGGFLPPDQVVRLAEGSGLIKQLGRWVLFEACRQAGAWHAAGLRPGRMAVNVSARQFYDNDLPALIRQALAEAALQPDALEIEITETALMDRPEQAVTQLHRLRDQGIRVALDDFGTGYSSLSYLSRFPVDKLKIDKSFVSAAADDPRAATIVRAVIALGAQMGLDVVAEGVETEGQRSLLLAAGCTQAQGWLYRRALPADTLTPQLPTAAAGRAQVTGRPRSPAPPRR